MKANPKSEMIAPKIGEIYLMNFYGQGSAQSGWRPGIIIQNDMGNYYSPNVIALPLTTSIKNTNQPTHVVLDPELTGLKIRSMVLCESPMSIPKTSIGNLITRLSKSQMRKVAEAFLISCPFIYYISSNDFSMIKNRASDLITI